MMLAMPKHHSRKEAFGKELAPGSRSRLEDGEKDPQNHLRHNENNRRTSPDLDSGEAILNHRDPHLNHADILRPLK
jgi:hypothetical protein